MTIAYSEWEGVKIFSLILYRGSQLRHNGEPRVPRENHIEFYMDLFIYFNHKLNLQFHIYGF